MTAPFRVFTGTLKMRSRPRDQFSPNLVCEGERCWRAHNKFEIVGNDARVFVGVVTITGIRAVVL